jgi:2-phosphoglycerate kinase
MRHEMVTIIDLDCVIKPEERNSRDVAASYITYYQEFFSNIRFVSRDKKFCDSYFTFIMYIQSDIDISISLVRSTFTKAIVISNNDKVKETILTAPLDTVVMTLKHPDRPTWIK